MRENGAFGMLYPRVAAASTSGARVAIWAISKSPGSPGIYVAGLFTAVPEGKQSDFRRAVAAKPGEKIVFTWQIWPDRASSQAAEERMHQDPRMDAAGDPPIDASRLILGCFQPMVAMGRH